MTGISVNVVDRIKLNSYIRAFIYFNEVFKILNLIFGKSIVEPADCSSYYGAL